MRSGVAWSGNSHSPGVLARNTAGSSSTQWRAWMQRWVSKRSSTSRPRASSGALDAAGRVESTAGGMAGSLVGGKGGSFAVASATRFTGHRCSISSVAMAMAMAMISRRQRCSAASSSGRRSSTEDCVNENAVYRLVHQAVLDLDGFGQHGHELVAVERGGQGGPLEQMWLCHFAQPPWGAEGRGSKSACADLDGPKAKRLWRLAEDVCRRPGGALTATAAPKCRAGFDFDTSLPSRHSSAPSQRPQRVRAVYFR